MASQAGLTALQSSLASHVERGTISAALAVVSQAGDTALSRREVQANVWRKICVLAISCAIAGSVSQSAVARDYRPARCTARRSYTGPPLHSAVEWAPPAAFVDEPLPSGVTQRITTAFDVARAAASAPAITAAVVRLGHGAWHATLAPEGTPLLYWASAGKTFTAVVVLQLADEGRLSLDDPIQKWIKDVPHGALVTVRDLLSHTSGLFSANEDVRARQDPRYRTPAEGLAIARRHGALFCPGEQWRYSNTGYDLLGEVVRLVDGRSIDVAITRRIVEPLGLRSLRVLTPGRSAADVARPAPRTGRPIDPSWPGAAGPVAGDAMDMARFWAALLSGRLLEPATTAQMFRTLYPMFDAGTFYGLGTMVFDIEGAGHRNLWLGHAGGTPGGGALVLYSPEDQAVVAVALTGDGPAPAVANTLLKALREALAHGPP